MIGMFGLREGPVITWAYYYTLYPTFTPHPLCILESPTNQGHTISIQLASRIWGSVRRTTREHATCQRQQQQHPNQCPLSLPIEGYGKIM